MSRHPSNVSLLRRFAAIVYDALIIFVLLMLVAFIAALLLPNPTQASVAFFYLITIPLAFGYFVLLWRYQGQTLGMKAWQIYLLTYDAQRMSFYYATIRGVFALLGLLLCGVGFWYQLFNKDRHCAHDKLSKSYLVFKKSGG